MWDWLLAVIDPSRGHEVGFALSWHARAMTLAWGVIAPTAVLVARYMKILPWQNWPEDLDNPTWWHVHLYGQTGAYVISLVGLALVWSSNDTLVFSLHKILGYSVLAFGTIQVGLGFLRGTKGGPTDPRPDGSLRGDHFDMSPWRLIFERVHKSLGYIALALGAAAILTGMWDANAPRWMWIAIIGYWLLLCLAATWCQLKGLCYDTYQAIWGPDPDLPGNKLRKVGVGTVRPGDCMHRFQGKAD